MNSYKIIVAGIFIFLLASCESRLDIDPAQSISGEQAIDSEENIENILISTYNEAGQSASYGGQLTILSDLLGSGPTTQWNGTFAAPREIKNKAMLPTNGWVSSFWNNSYATINQANIVLDNLDNVTSDPDKKNRIEGEARFLRGLVYFDLVRHFSSGSSGVPIRTVSILDFSIDLNIPRSSTEDAYALAVSDLESAVDLLPPSNGVFADKYSAQAVLARVRLYLGNYSAARDAAHDVITNSGHSLTGTYAAAFNNNQNGPEDVFTFQVTSQDGSNTFNTYYADQANGGRDGDISVTDAYITLFDDLLDSRANFFYLGGQLGDKLTLKYTNENANIPLVRLAEMYLIRAEANLEENTEVGDTPHNDLNLLRSRAGAELLTGVITNSTVLRERQLELAFEGFSLYDVIRTKGSVDGFSYDAPELVLPIPQREMDTNMEMVQNSGY